MRRNPYRNACFLMSLACLPGVATAQSEIDMQPTRDIYISDDGADGRGSDIYIATGTTSAGVRQRTLLSIDDLSGIPQDMTVLDVSLSLFVNLTSVGDV